MVLYATGDTHADFGRFSKARFPEQDTLSRDDFILIAGDFGGVWMPTQPHPLMDEKRRHDEIKREEYELDVLSRRSPTFCYVLGNHENWSRYDNNEFEVVDFHGGLAHRIRDNVYHLLSGCVYDFGGYTVFAFGGASSHDVVDGILDRDEFATDTEFKQAYKDWKKERALFRVKDFTWWQRECQPTEEEIGRGWDNLARHGNRVNCVLTHCLPQGVESVLLHGTQRPDAVTRYLQTVADTVHFDSWICGHYHTDATILDRYHIMYKKIVRIY